MFGLGLTEMSICAVIGLLVFGPRQLPRMAKGLGEGIRELRNSFKELNDNEEDDDQPKILP